MQSSFSLLSLFAIFGFGSIALATLSLGDLQDSPACQPLAIGRIDDERLRGGWSEVGNDAYFHLNVTPHVLLFASEDGGKLLEIAVDHQELNDDGGWLGGVVKAVRRGHRRSAGVSGRAVLRYRFVGDLLELQSTNPLPVLSDLGEEPMTLHRATDVPPPFRQE